MAKKKSTLNKEQSVFFLALQDIEKAISTGKVTEQTEALAKILRQFATIQEFEAKQVRLVLRQYSALKKGK